MPQSKQSLNVFVMQEKVEYSSTHVTATETHVPYGITQCYLPPGRGDSPAFIQLIKAGTRFSDPYNICAGESVDKCMLYNCLEWYK